MTREKSNYCPMSQMKSNRFLTIQSHVVSGYCGNKSSTFPLQLLGFEVDVINSVQLSNHTQYSLTKGQIFNGQQLNELHLGLKGNDLLRLYDNILSGYVADVGYIQTMANLIRDIKIARPDSTYCLDPVLGDVECGFYVQNGDSICKAYLEKLLPLADIITPNVFEASKLTGIEFNADPDIGLNSIFDMIKRLHELGPKTVAITSFELDKPSDTNNGVDYLYCILSHRDKELKDPESWLITIPRIPETFYGTGDLFAALLSAWSRRTSSNWKLSLETSVNTIQAILDDTWAYAKLCDDGSPLARELRLVQNQADILSPNMNLKAEPITSC